jgi:hypothetical protein
MKSALTLGLVTTQGVNLSLICPHPKSLSLRARDLKTHYDLLLPISPNATFLEVRHQVTAIRKSFA